jgi:hypothetical protein
VPPGFPGTVWSQRRTPLPCTAQGIGVDVFEKTFGMAALAGAAKASDATAADTATIQRTMFLLSR